MPSTPPSSSSNLKPPAREIFAPGRTLPAENALPTLARVNLEGKTLPENDTTGAPSR